MEHQALGLDRIDGMLRVLFQELKAMGGSASGATALKAIEPKLSLSDRDRSLTTTGRVRWETGVRWYTADCVRAGYLLKSKGVWTVTEKGLEALALPPGQLIREAGRLYDESRRAEEQTQEGSTIRSHGTLSTDQSESAAELAESPVADRQAVYEEALEQASTEIREHLDAMPEYDFQDFVAALLGAMGYFVRKVATRGKDGGIDIVVYRDPLGTITPRIRVQVKHVKEKVSAKDVRELEGLLRRDGDMGLYVSSAGFTPDALNEVRSSNRHIETMDQDRLIELWQSHYPKLDEQGKSFLPLKAVYFLAPENPVD